MAICKDYSIKFVAPPHVNVANTVVFSECQLPPLSAFGRALDDGNVFDCCVETEKRVYLVIRKI